MGFYGNISNVGRTNMVFDRIYSSRQAMDANAAKDGVYAGRYVLVEYDQDNKKDTHIQFYLKSSSFNADGSINISNSTICYSDRECSKILSIKAREGYFFKNNKIEYAASGSKDDSSGKITSLTGKDLIDSYLLFTVEGADINARRERYEEVKHILYYQKDSSTFVSCQNEDYISSRTYYTKKSGYQTNYLTDFNTYTETYDSTVWMKQYDNNGIPKYINIASLNTVTPTFDIRAEAPSDDPKAPDFDEDRTNLHYDLHITTPWGFKIKETDLQIKKHTTGYTNSSYSENVSDNGTQKIFFNKAAFDPQRGEAETALRKKVTLYEEDNISIINSSSNNMYWVKDKESGAWVQKGGQDDTKELSIVLPSIGNMMSDAWDIIYGPDRMSNMNEYEVEENGTTKYVDSLMGRLLSFRELPGGTLPYKWAKNGKFIGLTPTGTDWITVQLENPETESPTLKINHKALYTTNGNTKPSSENQTPSFGGSFVIPYVTYDMAGHIIEKSNTKVTLPTNGGNLILNGYSLDTSQTGNISNNDTLLNAFYKIENRKMDKENPNGSGSFSINRRNNTAIGENSIALGNNVTASGEAAYAEGSTTIASGDASHAEGQASQATGAVSHAEGIMSQASGNSAHAEGYYTAASGMCSHAEGSFTAAQGDYTHAEGADTIAFGAYSHAEGEGTIAQGLYQHVQGTYNIPIDDNTTIHIVGNGTSNENRSNAHIIEDTGNAWFAGEVYVGSTSGTDWDDGCKKLIHTGDTFKYSEGVDYTIVQLMTKVAALEQEINNLKNATTQ